MRTLLLCLSLVFVSSISAEAATLVCASYSKQFDVEIALSNSGAEMRVLRSIDRSTFALTAGEVINLGLGEVHDAAWSRFEGTSVRKQNVTLSFRNADLDRAREFKGSLMISSDWTDTTEVANQLDCRRK